MDYVKPMVKGAITAGAAAMVGGSLAGISFLAFVAPYALIVGGAITLTVIEATGILNSL